MLTIVTGDIDVGKTSYILDRFNAAKEGYGVATKKVFIDDSFVGYNLITLPDKIIYPFIYLKDQLEFNSLEHITKGRFIFLKETFDIANTFLFDSKNKEGIVWIDEVGSLELNGSGFDPFLQYILQTDKDIVVAVKENIIGTFISYYGIKKYEIIHI